MKIPAINKRIKQIIDYYTNGIVKKFAESIGLPQQTINRLFVVDNRTDKYPIATTDILQKISEMYDVNPEWLLTGKGEMLKDNNVQKIKEIKDNHGFAGQMTGGSVDVRHDEGKNMVIEKQEREMIKMFEAVIKMFEVLTNQLDKFHVVTTNRDEYVKRQDDYIKHQDEYLAGIIKNSYLRNERNMDRIDKLIELQNLLIDASNTTQHKTREQMDRILNILEKKLQ